MPSPASTRGAPVQPPAAPCAIAYEVAGRFVLNATKPGHLPASASVVVGADECHVLTVPVQLTLRTPGG